MTKTQNLNSWQKFKEKSSSTLSKMSKAFMLPIAILPFAGLMLGIGGAIGANSSSSGATDFANFLKGMSDVIFGNLPILFGASVAMAFTRKNALSAVFITLIAYFAFSGVQSAFIHMDGNVLKDIFYFHTKDSLKYMVGSNLGIKSLQTSIFGGIVIGSFVAYVLNRWSEIELPTALSFFSGIRLVPMIIIPLSAGLAIVFLIIWPFIGQAISTIGNSSINAPAGMDGLVYGMLGRALMPFGLHHVVIGMAWQSDLGGSINAKDFIDAKAALGLTGTNATEINSLITQLQSKGNIVGDQNIWNFLNGQSFNRIHTNNTGNSLPIFEWVTKHLGQYPGRFMQDYPIYIGACMGIGLAIILSSDKSQRRKTAAITGSAMAVAFLTGITEPLEFSFLFIAPLFYYIIYVPLSGIAYMLMKITGAHIGVGFARGFIDLLVYGAVPLQKGTHFYWAFIFAAAFAPFSFFTFYFMIKKFNWATPGRNGNIVELIDKKKYKAMKDKGFGDEDTSKVEQEILDIVKFYGGVDNLISVTACATRLRITVKDPKKIKINDIKKMGASGFIDKGKSSQAIFGGRAAILSGKINDTFGSKIGK